MINSFHPIERPHPRARIVKQIEDLVQSGQLGPRAKLPPERQLQRQLAVSRPLLREALHELAAAGLIEARHGLGWYVTDMTDSKMLSRPLSQYLLLGEISVHELLQARAVVENETAQLAAQRATDEEIAALHQLLRAMDAAENAYEQHIALDTAFHVKIAAIAANRLLLRILDSMHDLLTEYRRLLTIGVPERLIVANEEHARIVSAIQARDKDAAAAQMRAHLDAVNVEVNRRVWPG